MEDGKSHGLSTTSLGFSKVSGIVLIRGGRTENQRSQRCKSQSESKAQEPGAQIPKGRRRYGCLSPSTAYLHSSAFLFSSNPQILNNAHPHRWTQSSFPSQPIQTVLPGKTLTDSVRNRVLPAVWSSLRLVKLMHISNHHTVNMFISTVPGFPELLRSVVDFFHQVLKALSCFVSLLLLCFLFPFWLFSYTCTSPFYAVPHASIASCFLLFIYTNVFQYKYFYRLRFYFCQSSVHLKKLTVNSLFMIFNI